MTNPHLVPDPVHPGRTTFKSDKYAWCPPGFLPLKLTDPMAVDLIMLYAVRRLSVDAEFSEAIAEVINQLEETSPAPPLDGMIRILLERMRQINVKGWTAEHDDEHVNGEMARAAACYAIAASYDDHFRDGRKPNDKLLHEWSAGQHTKLRALWPWDWKWWKPKTPIRDLEKAGALIAAEIERRLRRGEKR